MSPPEVAEADDKLIMTSLLCRKRLDYGLVCVESRESVPIILMLLRR